MKCMIMVKHDCLYTSAKRVQRVLFKSALVIIQQGRKLQLPASWLNYRERETREKGLFPRMRKRADESVEKRGNIAVATLRKERYGKTTRTSGNSSVVEHREWSTHHRWRCRTPPPPPPQSESHISSHKVHVDTALITAGTDKILENFQKKLIPLFSVFSREKNGSSAKHCAAIGYIVRHPKALQRSYSNSRSQNTFWRE